MLRFACRVRVASFVAQAFRQPHRKRVAAEDHQIDVPEEGVVRGDDDGQQIRRGLGPLGEFFSAGDVLEQLMKQRRVPRRRVPALLQPLAKLGQLVVGDGARAIGRELHRGIRSGVVVDPFLARGRSAEKIVDAALQHAELLGKQRAKIRHITGDRSAFVGVEVGLALHDQVPRGARQSREQ